MSSRASFIKECVMIRTSYHIDFIFEANENADANLICEAIFGGISREIPQADWTRPHNQGGFGLSEYPPRMSSAERALNKPATLTARSPRLLKRVGQNVWNVLAAASREYVGGIPLVGKDIGQRGEFLKNVDIANKQALKTGIERMNQRREADIAAAANTYRTRQQNLPADAEAFVRAREQRYRGAVSQTIRSRIEAERDAAVAAAGAPRPGRRRGTISRGNLDRIRARYDRRMNRLPDIVDRLATRRGAVTTPEAIERRRQRMQTALEREGAEQVRAERLRTATELETQRIAKATAPRTSSKIGRGIGRAGKIATIVPLAIGGIATAAMIKQRAIDPAQSGWGGVPFDQDMDFMPQRLPGSQGDVTK